MQELLPMLLGVLAGSLLWRRGPARHRRAATVLLSVIGGALSTTINGEWGAGAAAFLADAALVGSSALAAMATLALLRHVRQRAARPTNS
jgi:hypothetical protein